MVEESQEGESSRCSIRGDKCGVGNIPRIWSVVVRIGVGIFLVDD